MKAVLSVQMAMRCYPKWWRDRYGEEARALSEDLLCEGRSETLLALNLLRGAVRTRLTAKGMPPDYRLWVARTRLSVALATLPCVVLLPLLLWSMGTENWHVPNGVPISQFGLTVGGLSIAIGDLMTIPPMGHYVPPAPVPPLTPGGRIAVDASVAVAILAILLFLCFFVGWLKVLSALKRSPSRDDRRLRRLARAPGFIFLLALPLLRTGSSAGSGALDGSSVITFQSELVFVGASLTSLVCIALVIKSADLQDADLWYGKVIATAISTLLGLLLIAYAAWVMGLMIQAHQSGHGTYSMISFSNVAIWPILMTGLVTTVATSLIGAITARKSWRVAASLR